MSIAKKVGKGDGDSPLFPMFRVCIFVTHHRLAGYKYSKFICLQCSWFKKKYVQVLLSLSRAQCLMI